jgi:hypothetical protein
MSDYLLLLHETPGHFAQMSPARIQATIERYMAWTRQLAERGQLVSAEKLADDGGRHLRRGAGAPLVSDGPYTEAKDVIGGFYVIRAESLEQAEAICAGCPHLDFGWIELRAIEALVAT